MSRLRGFADQADPLQGGFQSPIYFEYGGRVAALFLPKPSAARQPARQCLHCQQQADNKKRKSDGHEAAPPTEPVPAIPLPELAKTALLDGGESLLPDFDAGQMGDS